MLLLCPVSNASSMVSAASKPMKAPSIIDIGEDPSGLTSAGGDPGI